MFDDKRALLAEAGHVDLMMRVRPHAVKTQYVSTLEDGSIKIDLNAPAEEGRGNDALIRFLADGFQVPTGNVKILSGKTARLKLVRVTSAQR